MFSVAEALKLDVFRSARVVAGHGGLDRPIRWVHIVDIPDVASWVKGGELLLTTAISLKDKPDLQQKLIPSLVEKGLAGLVVAVGRYFHHIPPQMIAIADEMDFPIIELPFEVPFVEVTKAISQRIISEQYALLEQSIHIHQTLTSLVLKGEGLDALANALARLLRRPITIEDTSLTLLAYASHGQVDAARQASISQGRTPPQLLAKLKERGLFTELRRNPRPRRVEPLPELGMTMERIIAPIVAGGEIHGYVWVIAGDHPLEELDFLAIEHAATVAALIMLKEQAVREAEGRQRGDFLDRLLSEDFALTPATIEEAAGLNFDLERGHAVLILRPDEAEFGILCSLESLLDRFLRRRGKQALLAKKRGDLVVVLEVERAEEGQELMARFREEMAHLPADFAVGVGRVYTDPTELHRSYHEAQEALAIGRLLADGRRVIPFAELGFLHWLYHLPPARGEENVYLKKVHHLAAHDAEHGSNLLLTLETYLDNGANTLQAADALVIHRNTLLYRLRKVEGLCEINLSDPLERLNLHLAIKYHRLHAV